MRNIILASPFYLRCQSGIYTYMLQRSISTLIKKLYEYKREKGSMNAIKSKETRCI